MACAGSFAMLLKPHLFALMPASAEPMIRLEAMPQPGALSAVLEERLDIGISEHEPAHPGADAENLGKEELCLLMPSNLTATALSFQSVQDSGFVAHPDGLAYSDELFSLIF